MGERAYYPGRNTNDSLDLYLRELPAANLTREEEKALGARALRGDLNARNTLVERNLPFVVQFVKQYQGKGLELADLIQEGNQGLLRAASKFDPAYGVKFISYAVNWVRQHVLSALAVSGRTVRVPPSTNTEYWQVHQARQTLREMGYSPHEALRTAVEAQMLRSHPHWYEQGAPRTSGQKKRMAKLRASIEERYLSVHRIIQDDMLRLDQPKRSDEREQRLQHDSLADENQDIQTVLNRTSQTQVRATLERALDTLNVRDAAIIRSYYGLSDTQQPSDNAVRLSDAGAALGVSRERARQLRERGLARLREEFPHLANLRDS
jgi:RNA polymerase primary sigma factor